MLKVLALLSFGINAGVMFGITLYVAKNLSALEYSRYSFAVATAQMVGVCLSEWVRLAATRYYPGPDPKQAPLIRRTFLNTQYLIGSATSLVALIYALMTSDPYWFLITVHAFGLGVVDLQFILLRCDAQLSLFSRLQVLRCLASLALIVSAPSVMQSGIATLIAAILANLLTILALGIVRPDLVFARLSLRRDVILPQMASYGVSAATAGGFYQIGPFLMRCAAFRTDSQTAYAAFSLVMDLMQRPYDILLGAMHGIFLPDAIREHDRSPTADNAPFRFLLALDGWCLSIAFGCALAVRMELLPLIVRSDLSSDVQNVFPTIAAFFLLHSALNYVCALPLHFLHLRLAMIIQAMTESVAIAFSVAICMTMFGSTPGNVAYAGVVGAGIGFLMALTRWRCNASQLPWLSWIAALLTSLVLIVLGQLTGLEPIAGLVVKVLYAIPVILIGAYFGFARPFGLLNGRNMKESLQ